MCFNFGTDIYGLYSILSDYNRGLKISQFEESILSYGYIPELTSGRKLINSTRKIIGKSIVTEALENYYCYHPELYKGPLKPVGVPAIPNDGVVVDILRDVFRISMDSQN